MTDMIVPILSNSETEFSTFTEQAYTLEDYNGLFISSRQLALNFRHRISKPGYFSSWHVAGDPTLIIIRSGTLRIGLRNGNYRDFSAGDLFIAKDKLPKNEAFDEQVHGHTAQLIGEQELLALHIKLESL